MLKSELITSVKPILAYLGETPRDATMLARGATCSVWQIKSSTRVYALRIIEKAERVLDGGMDGFVRDAVRKNGGLVVAPVLNSESTGQAIDGRRWSLDEFAEGIHPQRGELPERICHQLGRTLAAVHTIPVKMFGKPLFIENGILIGGEDNPIEGVAQRFENPLPETWSNGFTHPVLSAMPEIRDAILARLKEVSERVLLGRPVLCHTDLHERQLICADNNLKALIDFGDAAILDPHWDLGSALYFHGERNFSAIFEAYSEAIMVSQDSARLAKAFSMAVAMHHGSRSRLSGKGHRLERAKQWLRHIT